jgi:hypothetical protein
MVGLGAKHFTLFSVRRHGFRLGRWQYSKGIDKAIVVKPSVTDATVVRVSQKIVHPVDPESVTDDDLAQEVFPPAERA